MKLHLPVRLRSALLACCAAVTSIVTTVGTGAIAGGAFVAVVAAQQAAAATAVDVTGTWTSDTADDAMFTEDNTDYSLSLNAENVTLTVNQAIYLSQVTVGATNPTTVTLNLGDGGSISAVTQNAEWGGGCINFGASVKNDGGSITLNVDVSEAQLATLTSAGTWSRVLLDTPVNDNNGIWNLSDAKALNLNVTGLDGYTVRTELATSLDDIGENEVGLYLKGGDVLYIVAKASGSVDPAYTTVGLAMSYNGMTDNDGSANTTREAAITKFAAMPDGGYMFNAGGTITDRQTDEGVLRQDAEGKTVLSLCPRTGAGGSGEAIVVSANEIAGQLVSSFTLGIASSSSETIAGSVALTLAVVETKDAGTTWNVYEKAEGSLTIGEGATLVLNLTDVIEEWTTDYKVVAVIDNTNQPTGITAGSNGMPYTLTDITISATGELTPVPVPSESVSLAPLSTNTSDAHGTWTLGNSCSIDTETNTYTGYKAWGSGAASRYTLTEAINMTNTADTLSFSCDITPANANTCMTLALEGAANAVVVGHVGYDKNTGVQAAWLPSTTGTYGITEADTALFTQSIADKFIAGQAVTLAGLIAWDDAKSKYCLTLTVGGESIVVDLADTLDITAIVISSAGPNKYDATTLSNLTIDFTAGGAEPTPTLSWGVLNTTGTWNEEAANTPWYTDDNEASAYADGTTYDVFFSGSPDGTTEAYTIDIAAAVDVNEMTVEGDEAFTFTKSGDGALNIKKGLIVTEYATATLNVGDLDVKALSNAGKLSFDGAVKATTVTNSGTLTAASINATGAFVSTGGTVKLTGDDAKLAADSIEISGTILDGTWSADGAVLGTGVSVAADGNVTLKDATLGGTVNNAGTLALSGSLNIADTDAAAFETQIDGESTYSDGANGFEIGSVIYTLDNGTGTLTVADGITVKKNGAAVDTAKYSFSTDKKQLTVTGEQIGTLYWVNEGEVTYDGTGFTGATGFALNGSTETTAELELNHAVTDLADGVQVKSGTNNKLTIGQGVEMTQNKLTVADGSEVTLHGSGTYELGAGASDFIAGASLGTDWTGTVVISTDEYSGRNLKNYANANSTVKFHGAAGHLDWNMTNEYDFNIELEDDGAAAALEINSGSQNRTYTFKGAVSGSGTIKYSLPADNGGDNNSYTFAGSVAGWYGSFVMAGDTKTVDVKFTGGDDINASTSVEAGTLNVTIGHDTKTTTVNSSIAATNVTIIGDTVVAAAGETEVAAAGETEEATGGSLSVSNKLMVDTGKSLTVNGTATLNGAVVNKGTITTSGDTTIGGALSGGGDLTVTGGALTLNGATNEGGSLTADTLNLGGNSLTLDGALTAGEITMSGITSASDPHLSIGSLDATAATTLTLLKSDLETIGNGDTAKLLTSGTAVDITKLILSAEGADEVNSQSVQVGSVVYTLGWDAVTGMVILTTSLALEEGDVVWNGGDGAGENYWYSGQLKSDASVWEPIGSLEDKGDAMGPIDVTAFGNSDKYVATPNAYGPDADNRIVLSGGGNDTINIYNELFTVENGEVVGTGTFEEKVVGDIYVNYTSDKEYELAGGDLKIVNNLDIQAGAVKVNNQTTVGGATTVGANGKLTIADVLISDEMTGHADATITVNAGGTLEVGKADIDGTLTNDGSLKLTGTGSTIEILAGSGNLELTEGASATIGSYGATNTTTVSSLTNKGSISVNGTIQVNGYSATNGSYVEGGDLSATNIILDDGTTKLDGVFGTVYTGGITGAHVTVESGSLTNPDVDTLKVTQGVVSIWEDDKELTIGSLEGDGTVELLGSASLNLTETTGGSTDVTVTGVGDLVLDEISENQLGDVTADKVTVDMDAYGAYADGDSLLTVKSLTTDSIVLDGDVLAGGTKYGILDIAGDLTDDMIADYQDKLVLDTDSLQAHAAAGGWVQLSGENGVLSMEFLDAAQAEDAGLENTWTVGDAATSNGLLVNGGAVPFYQSLDNVVSVSVDGDSSIDLTDAAGAGTAEDNATVEALGLTIRNLNGEGELEIKGDSAATDVATIFAPTDDSSAAGIDLVANNVTVNIGEPSTRMRFMLRAAAPGTIVLNSLTATGDAVYNVNKPTEVTDAVKLDGANTALHVKGGSLSIGGGLEGTGTITGEATITGTKADGSVFAGSYGDGATLHVTGGHQTLATGAKLTADASGSGAKLTLTGTESITSLAATDGATIVLAETAGAEASALTADKVTIDGADLEITLNTEDAVESLTDGPAIIAGSGKADVAKLTVNLTPATTVDVPTGEGAEKVTLALLMDGASAEDVALTTDAKTQTLLEKYFEMDSAIVDGDGYIVVDRNADYFTESSGSLLDEENAIAGAAMLDKALVYANPQGNAEQYSQLADIMTAVEGYTAAGNAKELNKLAAAVAGSSTASMGAALSGDMHRQLRAIRNRTTTMGVDQCVVNHDMPYFNAWINAEGNRAELDADGLNSGYTMDSWGGTVGFDVDASPQLTFGLAFTAMYGDFTAKSAEIASGDMDTYYLTAFARYVEGRWTHTFVAAAGKAETTLERTVHGYDMKGDSDGTAIGLMYEVGYVYALDEDATACLQPVLNFTFAHSSMSGYTENGGDAALEVGDMDMTTFTIGAGARLQAAVGENLYNRTSILEARALAKFNVGDKECSGSNGLAAIPGSATSVTSAEMGAVGFEFGAGLTIPVGQESGSIFVDASAEISSAYTNVNGTVGYRINF